MHSPHEVFALTPSDVAACVEVAAKVGWKPSVETWHWMLGMGEAWGVEHGERLGGAVVLFRFEDALAMVAMMMVRPDAQGLGIGRALLDQVHRRVSPSCVTALYASPEGERLYRPYGYVDEGAAKRFEGTPRVTDIPSGVHGRPVRPEDVPALVLLDAQAQGGSRRLLIESLVQRAERAVVVDGPSSIAAFGIAVHEDGARRLGPIVARNDEHALAVATALAVGADRARIDLEPGEQALEAWVARAGLEPNVISPRLVKGPGPLPGERSWIRALAGRPFG